MVTIYGDPQSTSPFVLSGDQKGSDDTFVFIDEFGQDSVFDFRQMEDVIEFQVNDVDSFDNLEFFYDPMVSDDTVITTSAPTTGMVKLVDHDNDTNPLSPADFLIT